MVSAMINQETMKAAEEAFGVNKRTDTIDRHHLDPTHLKILVIVKEFPSAANDRSLLLAKFYEDDWDSNKTLYDNFSRLTRPETVVRRFRDLRMWGYVKQSKEADKYNYEAMRSERDKHSKHLSHIFGDPMQELDNLSIEPPAFTPYKQTELL